MKYFLITLHFAVFFAVQISAQYASQNKSNIFEFLPEEPENQPAQVNAGFNAPVQDYGRKGRTSLFYNAGVGLLKLAYPSHNFATIQNLKSQPTPYLGIGWRIKLAKAIHFEFDVSGYKTQGAIEGVHYGYLFYSAQLTDTLYIYDEFIKLDWVNFQFAARFRIQPVSSLPVFISAGPGFQLEANNLSTVDRKETHVARLIQTNSGFMYKKIIPPTISQQTGHYDDGQGAFTLLFAVEAVPFPRWSKNVSIECGLNLGLTSINRLNVRQHFLNLGLKCKM